MDKRHHTIDVGGLEFQQLPRCEEACRRDMGCGGGVVVVVVVGD